MNNQRIKELRTQAKLMQAQLAERLGVDITNVSKWENGKNDPSSGLIGQMSKLFNCTTGYLLRVSDNPYPLKDEVELNDEYPCPLVGRVVAGTPIEAQENLEGYIYIKYKPANEYFALRVHGNSMINAGNPEGAVIVVHKQNYADNRQIVVALLNGEHTIKRFIRQSNDVILLQPENPTMSPIVVTKKDTLLILGVVKEIRIEV